VRLYHLPGTRSTRVGRLRSARVGCAVTTGATRITRARVVLRPPPRGGAPARHRATPRFNLPSASPFGLFFQLANIAEQHHRLRRRREYEYEGRVAPDRTSGLRQQRQWATLVIADPTKESAGRRLRRASTRPRALSARAATPPEHLAIPRQTMSLGIHVKLGPSSHFGGRLRWTLRSHN